MTNESPRVISLGLIDTSGTFTPALTQRTAPRFLILYFVVSASTFTIGVFVSRVFAILQDLAHVTSQLSP